MSGNDLAETKECVFCAEQIDCTALVCEFCGSEVNGNARQILAIEKRKANFPTNRSVLKRPELFLPILVILAGALYILPPFLREQAANRLIGNSPAETLTCQIDNFSYEGFQYKSFRLGCSLSAFKKQLKQDGLFASIQKEENPYEPEVRVYSIKGMTIAEIPWNPTFTFIRSDDVYRLAEIKGEIPYGEQDVQDALREKYGECRPMTGDLTWWDDWTDGPDPSEFHTTWIKLSEDKDHKVTLSYIYSPLQDAYSQILEAYEQRQDQKSRDETRQRSQDL